MIKVVCSSKVVVDNNHDVHTDIKIHCTRRTVCKKTARNNRSRAHSLGHCERRRQWWLVGTHKYVHYYIIGHDLVVC